MNRSDQTLRAVIFDADGVLIRPPKLFSRVYCAQRGLPPDHLDPFFANEFQSALRGEADLMELISASPLWNYRGNPQQLIDLWFASENHLDTGLVSLVHRLKEAGTPIFLATNQEHYRAAYFREVMFPDLFDGYFISCELGYTKVVDNYWALLTDRLAATMPDVTPSQMVFFDDSPGHIPPALRAGIKAHLYSSPDQVSAALSLAV